MVEDTVTMNFKTDLKDIIQNSMNLQPKHHRDTETYVTLFSSYKIIT
jgi:hypothetical protein